MRGGSQVVPTKLVLILPLQATVEKNLFGGLQEGHPGVIELFLGQLGV